MQRKRKRWPWLPFSLPGYVTPAWFNNCTTCNRDWVKKPRRRHSMSGAECIRHAQSDYVSTMVLPKGINEISTSLKCCLANGIPTIVIKRRTPNTTWVMATQMPPASIQMMFKRTEMQPPLDAVATAILPNGHKTKLASLKHCRPNGIPMTVKQSTKPPTI
jgi:hypothetical protein